MPAIAAAAMERVMSTAPGSPVSLHPQAPLGPHISGNRTQLLLCDHLDAHDGVGSQLSDRVRKQGSAGGLIFEANDESNSSA